MITFGNLLTVPPGPETGCGSEPCERRDARDSRETASAGPIPAQLTELRLLPPVPGAAVSRGPNRQCPVRRSRLFLANFGRLNFRRALGVSRTSRGPPVGGY